MAQGNLILIDKSGHSIGFGGAAIIMGWMMAFRG
jgi:hypothetical protein